jgi:hypothetical protein
MIMKQSREYCNSIHLKKQIIDTKGFVLVKKNIVLRFALWKHNTVQQCELLFSFFKEKQER